MTTTTEFINNVDAAIRQRIADAGEGEPASFIGYQGTLMEAGFGGQSPIYSSVREARRVSDLQDNTWATAPAGVFHWWDTGNPYGAVAFGTQQRGRELLTAHEMFPYRRAFGSLGLGVGFVHIETLDAVMGRYIGWSHRYGALAIQATPTFVEDEDGYDDDYEEDWDEDDD